ncbi:hypothetical protein EPUL_005495, partial [Erysiphe pulchra]
PTPSLIMDDFARLQTSVQSALVDTTRSATALAAEDLPFHRTVDPALSSALDTQNARLLSLASRLLGSATAHADNDVESNWTRVVDVVDSLLERADTALDEFTGAVKRLSPREQVGRMDNRNARGYLLTGLKTPVANKSSKASRNSAALRPQVIEKPQLTFEDKPFNQETQPFRPLLKSKPHASVALETQPSGSEKQFSHPYQLEIEQYKYPSTVYTHAEPISYHPFESTTATFVDTEEGLEEMLQELKKAKEVAIDLEHHDQRSYIGIVCLMQISTRDRDWIVDTLVPWRRKLQALNEVFADPTIVKVMHGAHMDMIWLQRDLGLYVLCFLAAEVHRSTSTEAIPDSRLAHSASTPGTGRLCPQRHTLSHAYIRQHAQRAHREVRFLSAPPRERQGPRRLPALERVCAPKIRAPCYDAETGQGAG